MGGGQSNESTIVKADTIKLYAVPVVLSPNKIHSFSSSSSTLDLSFKKEVGDPSQDGQIYKNQADKDMFQTLLLDYDCGPVIGRGSSGEVLEIIHKATGQKFACKVVHKSRMNDTDTMRTETEIMKRVSHRNIPGMFELYETDTVKWFIMEMATGGSLHTALASEEKYTEELIAKTFKQALETVSYLHEMGIVHRDLKQDNILCSVRASPVKGGKEYHVKIVDFGLSALIDTTDPLSMKKYRKLKELWGTKEYFAPELYKKAYGPQVDVWSLGCVLYELLTGDIPFPMREAKTSLLERALLNGGMHVRRCYELRPAWQTLSVEARDLLNMMLHIDPTVRYSIAECLKHPFIVRASLQGVKSTRVVSVSHHSDVAVLPIDGPKELNVLTEALAAANKSAKLRFAQREALVSEWEAAKVAPEEEEEDTEE